MGRKNVDRWYFQGLKICLPVWDRTTELFAALAHVDHFSTFWRWAVIGHRLQFLVGQRYIKAVAKMLKAINIQLFEGVGNVLRYCAIDGMEPTRIWISAS